MRVSYVTTYNALDIHNWSGLGFMIANTLQEQKMDVEFVGSLTAKPTIAMYFKKLLYKAQNKKYDFGRNRTTALQYASQVKSSLKFDTDVVFSPGTIPIALLETNKPKVVYTDATFAGMLGFYKDFVNLSAETIADGHFIEKQGLSSASLLVYSSEWAAQSAIADYGVDPQKVRVIPFGANLSSNWKLDEIKDIVGRRSLTELHLLFLAVDWERKGGDKALEVVQKLNELGIKATLHIVGIRNFPLPTVPPFVKHYGFISKATPEGKEILDELLAKSHFLLLPTVADCTPVVISEANSFGIPCLTSNVGGIPTIINEGINGKTFPLETNAESYVRYIANFVENPRLYRELALSAFQEYEQKLNWKVAGQNLTRAMREL